MALSDPPKKSENQDGRPNKAQPLVRAAEGEEQRTGPGGSTCHAKILKQIENANEKMLDVQGQLRELRAFQANQQDYIRRIGEMHNMQVHQALYDFNN